MTAAITPESEDVLPPRIALAFAPLHKRAFGVAIGAATGFTLFLVTALLILRAPDQGVGLSLLSQYFKGFSVTWPGAFIGLLWGFLVGYVGGWFLAFSRNMVIALSIFVIRAKSELSQTRDFLDHI
ncbi:MAG: hypothetical protein ABI613_05430 [Gemmatimonadota bacterium]